MRGSNFILTVLVLSACSGGLSQPTALFAPTDNSERVHSDVDYDTLWAIAGPDDTLLAMPSTLRPYGTQGVVYLDLHYGTVNLLGNDGAFQWAYGRRGEGPGELLNVRTFDVRESDGRIVLVDSGNQRILTLDPGGELVDEVPFPISGVVQSASMLSDGNMALWASGAPYWQVWNGSDKRPATGLPDAVQSLSSLQNQGRTAAWKDDNWVFGLGVGNGWFVFQDTTAIGVYPYAEHTNGPEIRYERQGMTRVTYMVERPASSARSLSVRGDTLYLLFGGNSPYSGRMMDKHDLNTGEYLGTDMLPHYANRAIVGTDGTVFTITNSGLFPSIVALTPNT